ncbi:MAG: HDOD domain-containing protein [Betaproteobacteria bacterium]|nr:HDOD domain-containing protein [Betaproteobacteria bacterium]
MTADKVIDWPPVEGVLAHSIKIVDIPPRPAIMDRIRAAMNEDIPNFNYVGQLISADVSLAAGLIKTANSPYFGFRSRARTINEALLMLGLDATCRAVAALCFRQSFPDSARYERFWDASARIAALSGWLAGRLEKSKIRPDNAYTFGLFRDCGIIILLCRFPDYAASLARANQNAELSFTSVEQLDFPTDHSVIGALLAQNWWLSDEMCQAIRHHHDRHAIDMFDSGLAMGSRYLIALSQTAEYLLQQVSGASQTREWEKLGSSSLRLLNLDADDLTELCVEAGALLKTVDY